MSVVVEQTHKMSLLETVTNTAVGFVINQTAQILIFPLFGIFIAYSVNFEIAVVFTVISVIRGFALRRAFQWHQRRLRRRSLK